LGEKIGQTLILVTSMFKALYILNHYNVFVTDIRVWHLSTNQNSK